MTESHPRPTPHESAVESPAPKASSSAGAVAAQVVATLKRLGPAGVLAGLSMALPAIGGVTLILVVNRVAPWLRAHGSVGPWLYAAGFSVLAGFALLPTYAQSLLGGWAFGFARGLPFALLGFLGASLIGYEVARRASGDRVLRLIDEHATWRAVYLALLGGRPMRTFWIVTLLRVPPTSPFSLTNLVLAATGVRRSIYAAATLVGMAPRTAVVVLAGAGMSEWGALVPTQRWLVVGGIVVTVGAVAVIGRLAQRALATVTQSPAGGAGR